MTLIPSDNTLYLLAAHFSNEVYSSRGPGRYQVYGCNVTRIDITTNSLWWHHGDRCSLYLVKANSISYAFITFMGTWSVYNATDYFDDPNLTSYDNGLMLSVDVVTERLKLYLEEKKISAKQFSWVCTGHSRGGVLAILTANELYKKGYVQTIYKVITFSSMKVPTVAKLVSHLRNIRRKNVTVQFYHSNDIFGNVPMMFGQHLPPSVCRIDIANAKNANGASINPWSLHNHSMEQYVRYLETLLVTV